MTTYAYTTPEIDWSTFPDADGEPMAENTENLVQMMDLIIALKALLAAQGRTRWMVGGNQFLYYNEHNGREHVAPDVYVGFDLAPHRRPSWKTWIEGKSPDIVWEISSESTWQEDVGTKLAVYARVGVREYYIFDPNGEAPSSLQGFALREGRMTPVPLLPGGGIMSPLLEAELRPIAMEETVYSPAAVYLRVIDPATGEPIPTAEELRDDYEEVQRDYLATRAWAAREEDARRLAEQRVAREEDARRLAEQRVAREEDARHAAEDRAATAEAALREALAALARQQGATPK